MVIGPLSKGQIEDFIERGWTLLRHAFPPAIAQAVRRDLGMQIGVDLDRPEQWTRPQVRLETMMTQSPYTDALTDRFQSAVDQLVGPGRWEMTHQMGWWPINFPGFDHPPYGDGWHIEGGWFRHHVSSPQQALLNLFCFSTVGPRRGAEPASSKDRTTWPPASCGGRSPTDWRPTISTSL
jgi:hypothetical protein